MTRNLRALAGRILPRGFTAGRRNWLILGDTATTALTGVALLVAAARVLTPELLSPFAVGQLVVVTTAGILRAALYGPAMAAQRTTGPASIPLSWGMKIALPAALLLSGPVVVLVPAPDWPLWWVSVAVAASVYLVQDALRNVLVSRAQPRVTLLADLITGSVIVGAIAFQRVPSSPSTLMLFWGAAGIPGLAYATIRARHQTASGSRDQTLSETWRLGRWGAVDASLAAVASLLPMIVSTALTSTTASGSYRVLLSALGPLNILFSTVITVLMLDSWRTATLAGIHALRGRVRTILIGMGVGALVYLPIALVGLVWVSGLQGPEVMRAAVIVGVAGVLGSANTPFNGAALALGRQHWGVGIRLITVVFAAAITAGSSSWVPWHDSIGVSMLVAAAVTLLGWAVAYAVADRRETTRLQRSSGGGRSHHHV